MTSEREEDYAFGFYDVTGVMSSFQHQPHRHNYVSSPGHSIIIPFYYRISLFRLENAPARKNAPFSPHNNVTNKSPRPPDGLP
jgi:hypothetical protein